MTNLVYLTVILGTNWTFTGDTKHTAGTNYAQMQAIVTKQTVIEEVTLCTNRTTYKVGAPLTNGTKWIVTGPGLPPLPPPLPTTSLGQRE